MDIMQIIGRIQEGETGGLTLEAGAAEVFDSNTTQDMSICRMDSTHAIVFYRTLGGSDYHKACCLVLDGTNISTGNILTVGSATTQYGAICSVDSTHAIAAMYDSSGGHAFCLTLSESTLSYTYGDGVYFEDNKVDTHIALCAMDSTHIIAAFRNETDSNYGKAVCLTLSGTSLSRGTPTTFNAANTTYVSLCKLDSTHAVVAYANGGYLTACCLTLDGTSISVGSPATPASSVYTNKSTALCAMDSTHAILAVMNGSASSRGDAYCISLDDDDVSFGTPTTFQSSDYAFDVHITQNLMDAAYAIATYRSYISSVWTWMACCLTLSGTTVQAGEPIEVDLMSTYVGVAIDAVDATHAIMAYSDGDNSNKGTACCITRS